MRMFALGRIKMLNLTDEGFTVPKDFHLDDFMRHSFKVMHDEFYTVKARISPGWARWVEEKIWHERKKAKKNGDGSLELIFRVAGLEEIKRWILSFGPEAVVLEPDKLKAIVRKDLIRNLGQYRARHTSMNLIRDFQVFESKRI